MCRHAIVFLTHIPSPRIFLHFKRLREETKDLLFPVLCFHNPVTSVGDRIEKTLSRLTTLTRCLEVDAASGARLLPQRYAEMQRRGGWYNRGFADLAYMPALMSERLRQYEFIWFIENDVDYAGNWAEFFADTMENKADLLTAYVYPRTENINWHYWSWLETPPEVPIERHLSSFNPIARFSRRMLSTYVEAVQSRRWQGHTEALWATVALHYGLTICDLGGTGPFCPQAWRNKYYRNPEVDGWNNREPGRGDMPPSLHPFWLSGSGACTVPAGGGAESAIGEVTFIWAPPVQNAFFHENPAGFRQRNVLYHPVKVGQSNLRRHYRRFKTMLGKLGKSPGKTTIYADPR